VLPAHAISIKNKHLLVVYSTPTRGFTAAVSVFRGTPPPKPLNCKSVLDHSGARFRSRWADPTGEEFVLLCAIFNFAVADIIETSWVDYSQMVHLWFAVVHCRYQGNKKPCSHGASRVWKIFVTILYLLASRLPKSVSGLCPRYDLDSPRLNKQPGLNRL
jgi:hypothetical protein